MKHYTKVAIIGVGLIGGSIGMALRKKRIASSVVGIGRNARSLKRARQVGAIDRWTLDIKDGVQDADLIVIATPVGQIVRKAKAVMRYAKAGAIITDVGSVKAAIVGPLEKLAPRGISFVGAHPLAGSEKKGASYGSAGLFTGCTVIITKTGRTNQKAVNELRRLWKIFGAARIVIMDPRKHDSIVAEISHLPHVVAAALCLGTRCEALKFAATGFMDTTRIAASIPEVWVDIFLMNRKNMLQVLDRYQRDIGRIKKSITRNKRKRLSNILDRARDTRVQCVSN